jgi:hypothetical protein
MPPELLARIRRYGGIPEKNRSDSTHLLPVFSKDTAVGKQLSIYSMLVIHAGPTGVPEQSSEWYQDRAYLFGGGQAFSRRNGLSLYVVIGGKGSGPNQPFTIGIYDNWSFVETLRCSHWQYKRVPNYLVAVLHVIVFLYGVNVDPERLRELYDVLGVPPSLQEYDLNAYKNAMTDKSSFSSGRDLRGKGANMGKGKGKLETE